ncbi:MAG: hypothetical protein ACE364_03805 [Chlorobiota bacterium]
MNDIDKIKNLFLFKEVTDEDNHNEPVVTVGSIVWGVLLRSSIIMVVTMIIMYIYGNNEMWYFSLFLIWLIALYPGWTQYQEYTDRIKKFTEDTLCGSCRNFNADSQLCKLYDEHVSTNHIPCEGEAWEPR